MKTITITLGTKVNTTKADDNAPWYVRAENAVKESVREVNKTRATCNAIREGLREELDAMYVEKAKAQMTALMAKRGLIVKFN